jgi:hypothetical protein
MVFLEGASQSLTAFIHSEEDNTEMRVSLFSVLEVEGSLAASWRELALFKKCDK